LEEGKEAQGGTLRIIRRAGKEVGEPPRVLEELKDWSEADPGARAWMR